MDFEQHIQASSTLRTTLSSPEAANKLRAADATVAYYSSSNEQLSASQLVPAAGPLHHIPPRQTI